MPAFKTPSPTPHFIPEFEIQLWNVVKVSRYQAAHAFVEKPPSIMMIRDENQGKVTRHTKCSSQVQISQGKKTPLIQGSIVITMLMIVLTNEHAQYNYTLEGVSCLH